MFPLPHRKQRRARITATLLTVLIACPAVTLLLARPSAARQTQFELNQKEARRAEQADRELNRVYKQLMSLLDAEGKAKLKRAQLAWIKYRDAHCEFEADSARGGSMSPMLYSAAAANITAQRTKELKDAITLYRGR